MLHLQLFSDIQPEDLQGVLEDEDTLCTHDILAHGTVLVMHILRERRSFKKLFEVMVDKFDTIFGRRHCLQVVHSKLKVCGSQDMLELQAYQWLHLTRCHCLLQVARVLHSKPFVVPRIQSLDLWLIKVVGYLL